MIKELRRDTKPNQSTVYKNTQKPTVKIIAEPSAPRLPTHQTPLNLLPIECVAKPFALTSPWYPVEGPLHYITTRSKSLPVTESVTSWLLPNINWRTLLIKTAPGRDRKKL